MLNVLDVVDFLFYKFVNNKAWHNYKTGYDLLIYIYFFFISHIKLACTNMKHGTSERKRQSVTFCVYKKTKNVIKRIQY